MNSNILLKSLVNIYLYIYVWTSMGKLPSVVFELKLFLHTMYIIIQNGDMAQLKKATWGFIFLKMYLTFVSLSFLIVVEIAYENKYQIIL